MSLVRQLVAILPLAYLLSNVFGLSAVWWAFPLSEIIALTMSFAMYRTIHRGMIAPLEQPLPELAGNPAPAN